MKNRARGNVMASRTDGGAADIERQQAAKDTTRLLAVLRAARRVCVNGRRVGRGTYQIDPASWMKLLYAVDDAESVIGFFDPHPGDAEAAGAIAAMKEVYG